MIRVLTGFAASLAICAMFAVTATVTRAQNAGAYAPTILNLDSGSRHPYKRQWPSQQTCDAALGNLNEVLAALRDPDPKVVSPEPKGDGQLVESLLSLVLQIAQNTGKFPNFAISCELQGDPA